MQEDSRDYSVPDDGEQMATNILRYLPDTVAILNAEGIVKYVTPGLRILLGYYPKEVTARPAFRLLHGVPEEKSKTRFKELQHNTGLFAEGLLQLRHKSGEVVSTDVRAINLLHQPDVKGILISLRPFRKGSPAKSNLPAPLLNKLAEIQIEARESAQQQIAADLHDHINPSLVAVKLLLDVYVQNMAVQSGKLRKASETIDTLINDIRNLSRFFAFERIEGFELSESLNILILSFSKHTAVRFVLRYDKTIDKLLGYEQKIHVYRIVQEQITNIFKHASATKVLIKVWHNRGRVNITTSDNGNGFDLHNRREGIGIANMVYRVNALKGNIQISSEVKAGTSILIHFPTDN